MASALVVDARGAVLESPAPSTAPAGVMALVRSSFRRAMASAESLPSRSCLQWFSSCSAESDWIRSPMRTRSWISYVPGSGNEEKA